MASFASADLSYLDAGDGRRIAVRHRLAAGGRPTVLFLPGYKSDMEGIKATAIDRFCGTQGLGCLRLDYSGTGRSAGDFADGTLEGWVDDVRVAIDGVAPQGPLIVIGSSMGGWIALHVALQRPHEVAAVIGIAAAPDFTDWGFTAEEKQHLTAHGRLERANPYGGDPSITHGGFWRSGEAHRLLDRQIELGVPVRLIHGELDSIVPTEVAFRLMRGLRSTDVQLRIIKNGGHNLSEPLELNAILIELAAVIDMIGARPSTSFDPKESL